MLVFPYQVSKPFQIFCLWLLTTKNLGMGTACNINEDYMKRWFYFYSKISQDKVIKVEKASNIGYTTFMSFYCFYLALNKPGSQIIVIEEKKSILSKVRLLEVLMNNNFSVTSIDPEATGMGGKMYFENGSSIKTLNPTTYNIKNIGEIELVFFDDCEVKNIEKLNNDISIALETSEIKKMILTTKNKVEEDFPEIKIIKII